CSDHSETRPAGLRGGVVTTPSEDVSHGRLLSRSRASSAPPALCGAARTARRRSRPRGSPVLAAVAACHRHRGGARVARRCGDAGATPFTPPAVNAPHLGTAAPLRCGVAVKATPLRPPRRAPARPCPRSTPHGEE